ncbi:MAG: molybdenum cofactor carrier protein [Sandaracinaceae bacterium]
MTIERLQVERLAIIGVMGSGVDAHEDLARPLGRWIAHEGHHLLTGGGKGVMTAVSRAFTEVTPRRGLTIGVLPDPEGREGYPNPYVEIPIRTHLPLSGANGTGPDSRNPINVLTADVVIALPGGPGTRSEVELSIRYARPLRLFGPAERFALFAAAERVDTLDELAAFVRAHVPR